jgi:hypothetical protein
MMFRRLVPGNNTKMSQIYADHPTVAQVARQFAVGVPKPERGVNIVTICPSVPEVVQRTTQSPLVLWQAGIDYGRLVFRVFGAKEMEWELDPIRTRDRII